MVDVPLVAGIPLDSIAMLKLVSAFVDEAPDVISPLEVDGTEVPSLADVEAVPMDAIDVASGEDVFIPAPKPEAGAVPSGEDEMTELFPGTEVGSGGVVGRIREVASGSVSESIPEVA